MKCRSLQPFIVEASSRFVSPLLTGRVWLVALPLGAAESGGPDTPEPGFVKAIAAATTVEDRE